MKECILAKLFIVLVVIDSYDILRCLYFKVFFFRLKLIYIKIYNRSYPENICLVDLNNIAMWLTSLRL